MRERETFLFLLIMPVVFTFLIGYATGGFSGISDPRLPVGFRDDDRSSISSALRDLLASSEVIRVQDSSQLSPVELEASVAEGDLAAAVIVQPGYGRSVQDGSPLRLVFIGEADSTVTTGIQSELLSRSIRLESAARTLFVHPNTVRYRLRRVGEITGLSPLLPRDAFALRIALTVGRLDPTVSPTAPHHT